MGVDLEVGDYSAQGFRDLATDIARKSDRHGLPREAEGLLNLANLKKDPDGSILMVGPAFEDSEKMYAYAEAAGQALYYFGLQADPRGHFFDHTDPILSVSGKAQKLDVDLSDFLAAAPKKYDHIVMKIRPEVIKAGMDDFSSRHPGEESRLVLKGGSFDAAQHRILVRLALATAQPVPGYVPAVTRPGLS